MTRPWRPPALSWPAVGIAVLALLCGEARSSRRWVHHVGDFCSHALYLSWIGLAAVLMAWRGLRLGERRLLLWPPAVGLLAAACVEGLKALTRLPRPDGDRSGFPSGHTTLAFGLAWLLSCTHPRLRLVWYAAAVSIGWSRIEGNAHFPYQVLCGALLGTGIGLGISALSGRGKKTPA